MKISDSGVSFLKKEEGERLVGYSDVRGIPTIGVGHTGTVDGNPVTVGMKITQNQSTKLLLDDLAWVSTAIDKNVRAELNQNQYDALTSLIFNIGATAFRYSTALKRLNAGDYTGAADAFLMWKRAGIDPDRLLGRRQRERALFLS
ncbi:muraminidase [Lonsdalea britannica]|uniref:Lysozyme n=1 Tax=Lonsdalea britannica TaxID=1082704 RepID=A0AAD0SHC1_9GAMM|nr:lysozyme [Lonsdalea britannica]AXW87809.1 muraminidase [Lonsdalea britannica]OSM95933.1 muraminidase [Lonsdalea britannica]